MSAEKCEFCGAVENVEYREPRWEDDEPPRVCDACAVKLGIARRQSKFRPEEPDR